MKGWNWLYNDISLISDHCSFCSGSYFTDFLSYCPFGLRNCNKSDLQLFTFGTVYDATPYSYVSVVLNTISISLTHSRTTVFVVGQALKFFKKKPVLLNPLFAGLELVVDVFLFNYKDALDFYAGECSWYIFLALYFIIFIILNI